MKTRKKKNGQVNHKQAPRNYAGLAAKPAAPVPLPKIVAFNAVGFGLGLHELFRRSQFRVSLPPVGEKHRHLKPLQPPKHLLQGCGASVSAFPANQLTGSAAICLPYPNFSFFDSRKCHISSNSIATSPSGVGFSYTFRAKFLTQYSTVEGSTPNIRAIAFIESPTTYKYSANARFVAFLSPL
jgi:hypothetical protein